MGLDRYIFKNPSQQGVANSKTMSDTVEVIIGAAYLDGDSDAAEAVMVTFGLR